MNKTINIENKFNILKGAQKFDLNKGEFISVNNIIDIEKLTNKKESSLLIAPAGSGKTTAIIKTAQEKREIVNKDTDAHDKETCEGKNIRVLLVPTTAIAEQLYKKHKNDNFSFFFNINKTEKVKNKINLEDSDLIISTYDSFKNFSFHLPQNTILYIDEAHEFNNFKSINSSKRFELQAIQFSEFTKIYITATPFNLYNEFKIKFLFKKNNNKRINILESDNITSSLVKLLLKMPNTKDEPTFVFLNSKKKGKKLKEKLLSLDPCLKIDLISSNRKETSESFKQLKENLNEFDIVISTKFLNIGFDIQNVFANVIYGDMKTDINAILQFLNRERQESNFYLLKRKDDDIVKQDFNINSYIKDLKMNNNLTLMEKKILNDCYFVNNGELSIDKHYIVKKNYEFISMTTNEIITIFDTLFLNFKKDDIKVKEENFKNIEKDLYYIKMDKNKVVDQLEKLLNENSFSKLLKIYFENGWLNSEDEDLGSSAASKLYKVLGKFNYSIIKNDAENIFENRNFLNKIDKVITSELISSQVNEKNLKIIQKNIDSTDNSTENLNKIMQNLNKKDEFFPEDIELFCEYLNKKKVFYKNTKWVKKNFKNNAENLFGLNLVSKRKKIEGKLVTIYINDKSHENINDIISDIIAEYK